MKHIYVTFPQGRFKALTLSYDDGNRADRRLVSILNQRGLKGTFHLNGGLLGKGENIDHQEVKSLYSGHEVSCHTFTHPTLERCPWEFITQQILEDRKALEALVGYPVRGLSYPNGSYSRELIELLPKLGIEYARVVPTTGSFTMPQDFLQWRGTCHHNQELLMRGKDFIALGKSQYLYLMYVWGHSYEFDRDNNWDVIESFAEELGGREDIWYATNIEIVDYMRCWKALCFSSDCGLVINPSARKVWLNVDGRIVELPGGETVRLEA